MWRSGRWRGSRNRGSSKLPALPREPRSQRSPSPERAVSEACSWTVRPSWIVGSPSITPGWPAASYGFEKPGFGSTARRHRFQFWRNLRAADCYPSGGPGGPPSGWFVPRGSAVGDRPGRRRDSRCRKTPDNLVFLQLLERGYKSFKIKTFRHWRVAFSLLFILSSNDCSIFHFCLLDKRKAVLYFR